MKDLNDISEDYKKYANQIYSLALMKTLNIKYSENILLNVFKTYVRYTPKFFNENQKEYWLMRIAIKKSNNHFRMRTKNSEKYIIENKNDSKIIEDINSFRTKVSDIALLLFYFEYKSEAISQILKMKHSRVNKIIDNLKVKQGGEKNAQ